MSSSTAISNEQVEKSTAWARAYYVACDSFDVRSWITKFYASNSGGQFGNLPLVKGQEACITLFESIFNPFSSMKHTIKHIDVIPERLYLDIEVTVLIKNDPERKPFLSVWGYSLFTHTLRTRLIDFSSYVSLCKNLLIVTLILYIRIVAVIILNKLVLCLFYCTFVCHIS